MSAAEDGPQFVPVGGLEDEARHASVAEAAKLAEQGRDDGGSGSGSSSGSGRSGTASARLCLSELMAQVRQQCGLPAWNQYLPVDAGAAGDDNEGPAAAAAVAAAAAMASAAAAPTAPPPDGIVQQNDATRTAWLWHLDAHILQGDQRSWCCVLSDEGLAGVVDTHLRQAGVQSEAAAEAAAASLNFRVRPMLACCADIVVLTYVLFFFTRSCVCFCGCCYGFL